MPQAEPEPAREPRIDAQRNIAAILEAAQALLAENPKATMGEIAERAEVHRVTLNRRFPSRDALIEQLLEQLAVRLNERITDEVTETGDAREALQRVTVTWLDETSHWRAVHYAPMAMLPRSGAANVELRGRITALFERGQREGSLRDDLSASILMDTWAALLLFWVAFDRGLTPAEIAETIVRIIGPAPG